MTNLTEQLEYNNILIAENEDISVKLEKSNKYNIYINDILEYSESHLRKALRIFKELINDNNLNLI